VDSIHVRHIPSAAVMQKSENMKPGRSDYRQIVSLPLLSKTRSSSQVMSSCVVQPRIPVARPKVVTS